MELRRFTLTDGYPADGPGWVYAWVWRDGVRYVGATWLDPAARALLHLHDDSEDPRSLALRDAVTRHGIPTVVAAPVPEGADRQVWKSALQGACERAGLLAADAVGAGRRVADGDGPDDAWLTTVLAQVRLLVQPV